MKTGSGSLDPTILQFVKSLNQMKFIVVATGVFAASTNLELVKRGHEVTMIDKGTLRHNLSASADINRVVRSDYGQGDSNKISKRNYFIQRVYYGLFLIQKSDKRIEKFL